MFFLSDLQDPACLANVAAGAGHTWYLVYNPCPLPVRNRVLGVRKYMVKGGEGVKLGGDVQWGQDPAYGFQHTLDIR